jgi:hypothetical protein
MATLKFICDIYGLSQAIGNHIVILNENSLCVYWILNFGCSKHDFFVVPTFKTYV